MARKDSPFFIYASARSGPFKGKRLFGINHLYKGDINSLTLADLLTFLSQENIDPSAVELPNGFSTTAITKKGT